jgi:hypothetical protein
MIYRLLQFDNQRSHSPFPVGEQEANLPKIRLWHAVPRPNEFLPEKNCESSTAPFAYVEH